MAGALDTAMDTASAMIDAPPDENLFVFHGGFSTDIACTLSFNALFLSSVHSFVVRGYRD